MLIRHLVGASTVPEVTAASGFNDFVDKICLKYDIDNVNKLRVLYRGCQVTDNDSLQEILNQPTDSVFVLQIATHLSCTDDLSFRSEGSLDQLSPEIDRNLDSSQSSTPCSRQSTSVRMELGPLSYSGESSQLKRPGDDPSRESQMAKIRRRNIEEESRTARDTFIGSAKNIASDVLKEHPDGNLFLTQYGAADDILDWDLQKILGIICHHIKSTTKPGGPTLASMKFKFAVGIVNLFPTLKDPDTLYGCEAIYTNSPEPAGKLEWKWKSMLRSLLRGRIGELKPERLGSSKRNSSGPCARISLDTEENRENIVTSDEDIQRNIHWLKLKGTEEQRAEVFFRMDKLFKYRNDKLHSATIDGAPISAGHILEEFPCFLAVRGLIDNEFRKLWPEAADLMLETWPVHKERTVNHVQARLARDSRPTVINELMKPYLIDLDSECEFVNNLAVLKMLIAQLPPTAQGNKKGIRVSARAAVGYLLEMHAPGVDIDQLLEQKAVLYKQRKEQRSPYLLFVGTQDKIDAGFIIIDHCAIATDTNLVKALDELFKAHYAFVLEYQPQLSNFFTFLQTAIYKLRKDAHEAPTVRRFRLQLESKA